MKTQMNVSPKMIGNLLDDVFGNDGLLMSRGFRSFVKNPPVNISKSKEGYVLQLLTPGINKELVHIDVVNNVLKISYEHKEAIAEDVQVVKNEFLVGSFERSFSLDSKMDVEGISARYDNGILSIDIPVKQEEQPKEIRVNIG